MAFNDDSFIREVNEELRSEQLRGAWSRYGRIVIALAVLIVVATAAHRGYIYWQDYRASGSGDQFAAALKLADEKKTDDALAAFAAVEKEGHGAYPVLSKMRSATLLADKGDTAAAVSTFSEIGKDMSVLPQLREVARMRAGWLLVDSGTYEQVSAEVEQMAVPEHALRNSAREALGLSAYKAGDMKRAKDWFQDITDDQNAPRNVANRAQMLLDIIAASGKAP